MSHIDLGCVRCGASHAADMLTLACEECGSPLSVRYSAGATSTIGQGIPMPYHDSGSTVSLGEGNTPCLDLPALGKLLGLRRLIAKAEYQNPTGSFKDRGTSVMMSVAKEQGVTEIVEDSSGNAGASVSAYAVRAGIRAHVFVPADAPAAKIQQIRVFGAETHPIEGSREAVTDAAIAYYTKRRLVYASHNLSPYFLEGTKTFAYEAAGQLAGDPPDHVVVPVGNGSLVAGPWKGYRELERAGRVSRIPRFHCVQARAVMPIAAAYEGKDWSAVDGQGTIAGGISVGAPPRKSQILDVLRETGGVALAVEDEEIAAWQKLLAEREGIYAEPTSAAAFAGLEHLVNRGDISPGDCVLVPITGSGLKDTPPEPGGTG